ncbi:complex I 51 kDa subunit family protein [Anaerovorax odorimutans]|uniref:complex I 51 kDa subunit family protein n=1 Tax=Anaerovorax odorimutans TaxID=109327 RepID=UPI00040F2993|nr:NADH-ubiquinone oxidoreductase-F iron-sulfur binding region domain-containing protein [Anaerovorax odorimutans]
MDKSVSIVSKNFKKIKVDTIDDYLEVGGYESLKKALSIEPSEIIEMVKSSGLKGRGGAAFPTGKKWEQASKVEGDTYILCNADEGEPSTFKDRYFLEYDPYRIIEGMTIAAYAVGGREGIIYIREEYGRIREIMKKAIANAKAGGYLGENILGSNLSFDIKVVSGAGAFICGETTALIESIEGRGGRPRIKVKRTAEAGLFDKPTLANNIESYGVVTTLLSEDAEKYLNCGTSISKGTKIISLCGNVEKPGVYEVPFGITLREIIYDLGGGIKDGRHFKFAQVGGASGPLVPKSMLDIKYSYEDFKEKDFSIGSGAVLVADDTNRISEFMVTVQEFFAHESCGKCTPCREGNRQLLKIAHRFAERKGEMEDIYKIQRLANIMQKCSFCGLGTAAPTVMVTAIKHFYDDLKENMVENKI